MPGGRNARAAAPCIPFPISAGWQQTDVDPAYRAIGEGRRVQVAVGAGVARAPRVLQGCTPVRWVLIQGGIYVAGTPRLWGRAA